MAIVPNSLNNVVDCVVKHAGILRHQSGQGFQLVFLILNNLDENTTDGNAGVSVNFDPALNVLIFESTRSRESYDLNQRRSPKNFAFGSNGIMCRKNILQRKCCDRSPTI